MPTTVLPAPPDFQTLRRACCGLVDASGSEKDVPV